MKRAALALTFSCVAILGHCLPASASPSAAEAEALAVLEAELPGTLMNNPLNATWNTHGSNQSAKVVHVPEIPGEYAYEVRVRQAGRNPWDVSAASGLTSGVNEGDTVLVAFWARASQPSAETGAGTAQVRVQQIAAPYAGVAESLVTIRPEWQLHYVKGISPASYSAGEISMAFNIGSQKQTLQFGQFYVMNLGPGVRLEDLPSAPEGL